MILIKLCQFVNYFLKNVGIQIVKSQSATDMVSAISRIHQHDFEISTIVDIGASNGRWSKEALRIFPTAKFLAIDPLTENLASLEQLSRIHSNFGFVICAAGGDEGGEALLNVSEDLDGSTIGAGEQEENSRKVRVRTIDGLVNEKTLSGPFLLKFDTHGFEIPIIEGASETLKQTNVIIIEVYNFQITDITKRFHEICHYLENLGFRCYDMAEPLLRDYDNTFWQMDLFFCRRNSEIFNHKEYR